MLRVTVLAALPPLSRAPLPALERQGTSPAGSSSQQQPFSEELFPAAVLQYRCSGLCCECGVIAQPWCGSTAWLLDTAQENSPHLYSREMRAAPAPWHSVPGGMSLSLPSSFCAGLQLWCFHSALCCRNHSRALGLLCISWKEGTSQEGRPQHQSVSMCKEIPDTVQGLYGI